MFHPFRFFSRTPPTNVPIAFWDHFGATRVVIVLLISGVYLYWSVVLLLLVVSPPQVLHMRGAFKILSVAGSLVVIRLGPYLYKKSKMTYCKWIMTQEYEICYRCGYRLRSLPERYHCPECGTEFSKKALAAMWNDWRTSDK